MGYKLFRKLDSGSGDKFTRNATLEYIINFDF